MIEILLTVLYGLATIGGLFMTYVWGWVSYRARCASSKLDQFCMIAVALTLGSVSNIVLFGSALHDALRYGISPAVLNAPRLPFIIAGLVIMGVSKWMLMFAHDMNVHCRSWRWFVFVSVLWAVLSPAALIWGGI